MHEHDRDLIMALADGTLDTAEVPDAEATIAACEECAGELAMQRLALEFLSDAPEAHLTEIESRRLHRDLRRELNIEPNAVAAPRERRINWNRWVAISAAAAVLIGVVAVAPNLDLLGGSDSADVATQSTIAAASATTTLDPDLVSALQPAAAGGEESPAFDAAAESADTTGAPALSTTAAPPSRTLLEADDFDVERYAFFAATPDLATLRLTVIAEDAVPELTRRAIGELATDVALLDWISVNACLNVGIQEFGAPEQAIALGAGEFDAAEALFLAYVLGEVEDTVVVAHDATTCDVLAESAP